MGDGLHHDGAGGRNIFFVVFALSGFSGLIYESIWTQYLKLFLGHAAYAQALVLAIFMAGMALGSWISSRYSGKLKNPLLAYALTEGAIGLFALFFHSSFDYAITMSYASILPRLASPAAVVGYKWTLSSAMILPQSILLGMTFPLMTAGILRRFPDSPGNSVALVYFTNSIGAAAGVVVSGFLLVKLVGLPGTMRTAGLINIFLAVLVGRLVRGESAAPRDSYATAVSGADPGGRWPQLLLLASLLTGTASFIYEIGWIRMLSLVLGSSTHSFELMLSSFILGLALGGLWIRRRMDGDVNTVGLLALIQAVMGLLALSTLLVYGNTFGVMRWLVTTMSRTEAGYVFFNIFCNGIALAVMLPATFCAGMTLPLITVSLLRRGYGEKGIGAVYAANTVGAIIGVFFSIHIGLPLLGLKGLIIAGSAIDMAVGVVCFWAAENQRRGLSTAVTVLCIGAVVAALSLVHLDPYKMASGVYRSGNLLNPQRVKLRYHADGKTATVSLLEDDAGRMAISTNGKVDASINVAGPPEATSPDEATMTLAAAIPMAIQPEAKSVANIGLGSGLTTQTLLGNPRLDRVDTIEIERQMVEAARQFGPLVDRVYTDPRSRIYIDDAKTFFSVYQRRYDIIISEPSNPWVSGVAGLFSDEFYRTVKQYLNRRGLFVQWLQLYETDVNLVASVLKAVSGNFSDYAVYATTGVNIVVVAVPEGTIAELNPEILTMLEIAEALRKVQVEDIQDIMSRKLGDKKAFSEFLESFPIRANSDYYPVLDQNADRTRFLQSHATDLLTISDNELPVLEMLGSSRRYSAHTLATPSPFYSKSLSASAALEIRDYLMRGDFGPSSRLPDDSKHQVAQFKERARACRPEEIHDLWVKNFPNLAVMALPYLSPEESEGVWEALHITSCIPKLSQADREWISLFEAVGRRDGLSMAARAQTILAHGGDVSPAAFKYVVASGMLGSIAEGKKEEARALWNRYGQSLFEKSEPDLLFRLLVAKSAG